MNRILYLIIKTGSHIYNILNHFLTTKKKIKWPTVTGVFGDQFIFR